jgi:hypothetical protein
VEEAGWKDEVDAVASGRGGGLGDFCG